MNDHNRWLSIITVVVFILAASGAAYALYTLLPGLIGNPLSKLVLLVIGVLIIALFLIIAVPSIRRH
ncbi:MAG TPA: hypothetical protein VF131_10225 [Blastocatellia bacterium]|nr:hypothetical protein [Blastocatellia bacterium]